ncbi:nucleotidyltransferase family protein [Candidatus Berkelbacteria bacterium]|nr:nucleotidyltransferase family protein [Candidatus Berkelbacteria bacterium]
MERERVTITIRRDLLSRVDHTIDGVRIRNRSHAIESLLTRSLGSELGTAVILAGGEGLQMRPFTYELPKSLIPIKNRPILEHIIAQLREHGIRRIILLIDYLGQKIEAHFGDGSRFGVEITYLRDTKPRGTGGALRAVAPLVGEQPFFVLHGDVLTQINLSEMAKFHESQHRRATMALTSVADPSAYGAVRVSGTSIVDFLEKPQTDPGVSRLINAGIYVLDPAVLSLIPAKGTSYLEQDVFPKLVAQQELTGYVFEGLWFDISTPEVYERALKSWKS